LKRINPEPATPNTRVLGDREVGAVALGTAGWALDPHPLDRKRAEQVVAAALDNGVTLLDTGLAYTTRRRESYAEELLGCALRRLPGRDKVLIATKGGHFRRDDEFPIDARPEVLRAHCEQSLRVLGVDAIGLYQLHKPDPAVPVAESMGAIADLQREGKVRLAGISNAVVAQLDEAAATVTLASVQNRLRDGLADPVLDWCDEHQVAFLAYSPLQIGHHAVRTIAEIATARQVSRHRIALARLLPRSPRIIPIVGARRVETITDSAKAATLRLSSAELRLLATQP